MTASAQYPGHHHRLPYTRAGGHEHVVRRGLDFTRAVLAEHRPDMDQAALGDVLLVVAELLANASEHTDGPTGLELRLAPADHRGRASVRIEVTDPSPDPPRPRNPAPGEPHGRGLRIIERTASAWGADPVPGGKTVWAELPLRAPAAALHGARPQQRDDRP